MSGGFGLIGGGFLAPPVVRLAAGVTALTSGRVALIGTDGGITDDADLTYNASTNILTVGGNVASPFYSATTPASGFLLQAKGGLIHPASGENGGRNVVYSESTFPTGALSRLATGSTGVDFRIHNDVGARTAGYLIAAGDGTTYTQKWAVDFSGKLVFIAGNEQTTVGAAGGASALPATPTKYMKVIDSAGSTLVIPAYAAA